MRTNRSIRLGIALIAGAFVLLVVYLILRGRNTQPTVAQNTLPPDGVTPVSVNTGRRAAIAIEDIPERSIITPNMFRVEDLPEDAPPGDYVTLPESQAIGFITRRRILRNNRIRMSDLVGHITDVGVAGALRPGTRAMTVTLANKPTFHDIVRIGDTVDIIAAFDQAESRTIVENVRVLAVDVFGKDYPQTSIALRGDYKAPQRSIRTANPPSPGGNNAGGAANTASTPATPDASGQPVAGQPAPAPTPTPSPTPPPPRPAPALVVEVTPDQANRISLAQNSGGVLDFIIVPHETVVVVPGAEARVAAVTRPQIAPYAEGRKRATSAGARTRNVSTGSSGSGSRGNAPSFAVPIMPEPAPIPGTTTPPMTIQASQPATYNIPVYVDGKRVRTDVVRKPQD
jgi:Flp pilus assembly protein CpaB